MRLQLHPHIAVLAGTMLPSMAACASNDAPDDDLTAHRPPEVVRLVPAEQAIESAHLLTLDLSAMNEAQIQLALGAEPHCAFRYAARGKPVFAVISRSNAEGKAVIKLRGSLVRLATGPQQGAFEPGTKIEASAVPIKVRIFCDGSDDSGAEAHRDANAVLEISDRLKVGYRGYVDCRPAPAPGAPPAKRISD